MVWLLVVVLALALLVVATLFYRYAQGVERDVSDSIGRVPPPMFAGTQRKVRRDDASGHAPQD